MLDRSVDSVRQPSRGKRQIGDGHPSLHLFKGRLELSVIPLPPHFGIGLGVDALRFEYGCQALLRLLRSDFF